MTLRIFEVSTDGIAKAVALESERREAASPRVPPAEPQPSQPSRPERWTGSSEWDQLRARLKEQEPKMEPPARRRR